MSDELSRRRLGSVPNQPSNDVGDSSGWQHHGTEEPLDMNAVRADDEFLEALARDMPVSTADDAEYQLAGLLAGWRHDMLSEPAPEFPSVDDVERAIIASQPRPARKAVRHLRLASGAAAVVVVAAAGLTVLSQGAAPGDPLWGVKKVVFAEQASQTQAATNAQQNLELAEEAMARGETTQAQQLVDKAAQDLKPVRDEKTRKQMDDWIGRLRASAPNTAATSKSSASATDTKTEPSDKSSDPATIPPDIRNQLRSSQTTEPPQTSQTVPSTVPEVPSTTDQTAVPTPSTRTATPRPRPTTGLPPLSIRPN
ncbi:anti-sigma-D factor RsdA [Gordonia sp. CPCC 205333]|uniref:anti-sigma-D factor RsdA n=1 Tax=Gordonia sp. CPCC 205333 TaxID=3140790 RepID=UPI003AF3E84C